MSKIKKENIAKGTCFPSRGCIKSGRK